MREFDVAVVGAGAAGLSLTRRLDRMKPQADGGVGAVALIEAPPGPLRAPVRTWCFWEAGGGPWDDVLAARWSLLEVVGPGGDATAAPISPLSYKMLRSTDFEAHVRAGMSGRVEEIGAAVEEIEDGPDRAVVRGRDASGGPVEVAARWVFDSRPVPVPPSARTTLLQHFRGWFVRTAADAFDPGRAVLMDLRPPQPRNGVAFGYVLPLSPREALVEYTEFTRGVLDGAGYDAALRDYTGRVLELGAFEVTGVEQGAIPMTDGAFRTRPGRRVFRIGAAGGATRPSTGYTFSGIQRQAAAVAGALARGRTPVPPVPHLRRHLAMDAVLLRALDTGRIDGAAFFAGLFRRNGIPGVLAFLDGGSRLPGELAMGFTTPVAPMALTTAECAWRALLRR
ncbi:lycopene cyclase family protein [Nocardiopsis mangrovi]|uniref:Lycopene cyclase family protein n=1 Tax=Nocardiopsis mangrovi TaxID=1179818 RepID=A0ABV9E0D1_9ACTN